MVHKAGKSDKPNKRSGPFVADVNKIKFEGKYIGWEYTPFTFHVHNESEDRYAWKLKSSSSTHYKIGTPLGILDPGASTEMVFYHLPGILIPRNGVHHVSIFWIKLAKRDLNARIAWQLRAPEGCLKLSIEFPKKLLEPKYAKNKAARSVGVETQADPEEFAAMKQHFLITNPELRIIKEKKKEEEGDGKAKAES
uniref:Major sperm protein n=1 Tax=Caenorhabditis japonica TaxID=281687 RepID=A0A8R1I7W7_CAEJA